MVEIRVPERTIEARPATAGWNLIKTAAQIVVFWGLFLGILPWAIRTAETRCGVRTFEPWTLAGQGLFGAAGLVGLWCAALFAVVGRGTPMPQDTATRLVILGPYRMVRNPMALAGITQGIAVGIATGSWATIAYSLAGAILWHCGIRPWEERDLRRRFGATYEAYERTVPLWFPTWRPYPALRPGREP